MVRTIRGWLALPALLILSTVALAQDPSKTIQVPAPKLPPAPARDKVAATVNNRKIPEIAVYRALTQIPPEKWGKARTEALSFLIENMLVDQYLEQLKIPADEKEVQKRLGEIQAEVKKEGKDWKQFLDNLFLTEAEMREQIVGSIRWDKFMDKFGDEKTLQKFFEGNKSWFDGTLVKAKHILIKPSTNTKEAAEVARKTAKDLKTAIEAKVKAEVDKLPASTDALTIAKKRTETLDSVFSAVARDKSDCPSKSQGGDIGYFDRIGKMVEPFAHAAFGQKVYEMSEPVGTEFGYHLILTTDRKPGMNVKFEDVKRFVAAVHAERLREAILDKMRPISKISIESAK